MHMRWTRRGVPIRRGRHADIRCSGQPMPLRSCPALPASSPSSGQRETGRSPASWERSLRRGGSRSSGVRAAARARAATMTKTIDGLFSERPRATMLRRQPSPMALRHRSSRAGPVPEQEAVPRTPFPSAPGRRPPRRSSSSTTAMQRRRGSTPASLRPTPRSSTPPVRARSP